MLHALYSAFRVEDSSTITFSCVKDICCGPIYIENNKLLWIAGVLGGLKDLPTPMLGNYIFFRNLMVKTVIQHSYCISFNLYVVNPVMTTQKNIYTYHKYLLIKGQPMTSYRKFDSL